MKETEKWVKEPEIIELLIPHGLRFCGTRPLALKQSESKNRWIRTPVRAFLTAIHERLGEEAPGKVMIAGDGGAGELPEHDPPPGIGLHQLVSKDRRHELIRLRQVLAHPHPEKGEALTFSFEGMLMEGKARACADRRLDPKRRAGQGAVGQGGESEVDQVEAVPGFTKGDPFLTGVFKCADLAGGGILAD